MKKKLFGILLFSVLLSSLVYAEADADKMREKREQREKQQEMVENSNSVKNSNENVAGTTTTNLTPEEEKEAYEALERVRARILKEDEERAELLKAAAEQQVQ